eukprot:8096406-Prorocentrum_lima.AAC.1
MIQSAAQLRRRNMGRVLSPTDSRFDAGLEGTEATFVRSFQSACRALADTAGESRRLAGTGKGDPA